MKIVLQRVSKASVEIDADVVGKIGRGLVILLGVERGASIKRRGSATEWSYRSGEQTENSS